MAYKIQDLKIIPTGVNLAAPGDQVAAGDCLELTGWWPSSVGKLQQTKGYTQRAASVGMPGGPQTIAEETGRVYFGGGTFLAQINRGLIEGGYEDAPGLIGYQNIMWVMDRFKQRRDNGVTTSPWGTEVPPAAPTSANTTGEHLPDGDYEYYVTWIDQQLYESNPSAVLSVTLAGTDDGKVTITRPTATTAALIYGWNVYRRSPGGVQKYKLNTDVIVYATSTYVDTGGPGQSADDLIGADEVMEEDHDAPPACRVLADKTFNDRIVAANSAEFPNRIYYTKSGQPAFFPESQFVDCGADTGDEILNISVKPGMLVIYRQRSIWRQVGDFDDDAVRIEPLVPEMGITGKTAVAATSRGDYFVGGREGVAHGVYLLNDWAQKVSQKIDPVFQGFDLENYALLNQSTADLCALGFNGGRLWFSYPGPLAGANTETFILDTETDRWFSRAGGFSVFYNGSQYFLAGGPDGTGTLQSLEDGLTDNGIRTEVAYQSPYEDCGFPDHEKTFADLVIDHNTQGAGLTVEVRLNKSRTGGGIDNGFTIARINSTTPTRETIALIYPENHVEVAKRGEPIRGYNLSVRISGQGPAGGFASIDTPILLHYYVEARKGLTFDSGPTDHGLPGVVKTVDMLEFDIDTEHVVIVQIFSDLPDGELTTRDAHILAATEGRKIVTLPIPAQEGKLFRYRLVGAAFQVYGMRARVLPIGTYVDGAIGEVWDSEPLAA